MKKKGFFWSLAVGVAALAAAYGFGKNAKIDTSRLPESARTAIVQEHKTLNTEFDNIINLLNQGKLEEARTAIQTASSLADTLSHTDTHYKMLEGQLKVLKEVLDCVKTFNDIVLSVDFGRQLKEYQKGTMKGIIFNDNGVLILRTAYSIVNNDVVKNNPDFKNSLINMLDALCTERLNQLTGWKAQLEGMKKEKPGDKEIQWYLEKVTEYVGYYEGIHANLMAGLPI